MSTSPSVGKAEKPLPALHWQGSRGCPGGTWSRLGAHEGCEEGWPEDCQCGAQATGWPGSRPAC